MNPNNPLIQPIQPGFRNVHLEVNGKLEPVCWYPNGSRLGPTTSTTPFITGAPAGVGNGGIYPMIDGNARYRVKLYNGAGGGTFLIKFVP